MEKVIYVDMDNVIANFSIEPNAIERFATEKGFFRNLKPIPNNIKAINMLLNDNRDVRILTKSPHFGADQEKIEWVEEHIPRLPKEKIHLCRIGQDKSQYAEDMSNSILLDDYGFNCREWVSKGGQAIKIVDKMQMINLVVDKAI